MNKATFDNEPEESELKLVRMPISFLLCQKKIENERA